MKNKIIIRAILAQLMHHLTTREMKSMFRPIRLLFVLMMMVSLLAGCADEAAPDVQEAELPDFSAKAASDPTEEPAPDEADDWTVPLAEYVESRLAADGIAGAAVAVVQADDQLWVQGFGQRDVEAGLPVTPDTLFHIGSITKSMTALLAASLVEEGLIDWDGPVVSVYPDFALADANATATVTMRHLLSMTSGIPDSAEDEFDVEGSDPWTMFDYLAETPLPAAPGEVFSYSNLSASAAGYLSVLAVDPAAEDLYGGYETLLQQRVLQPIGMTTAVVRVSEARRNPNYGHSYVSGDDGQPVSADPEDVDGDVLAPSGTVKANVEEMGRYVQTMLAGGVAPDGKRVVEADTLETLWEPDLEDYGLGWEIGEVGGETLIMHEGSFDNYLGVVGFWPEADLGFVILTNTAEAAEQLIADFPEVLWESWE